MKASHLYISKLILILKLTQSNFLQFIVIRLFLLYFSKFFGNNF